MSALLDPPPHVFDIGQVLETDDEGAWRIEDILGWGGMGIVYRIVKVSKSGALDKYDAPRFAAKVIRREYWNRPDVLNRFKREAGVSRAHKKHENIIRLHGFCFTTNTPQPVPMIIMDLIEGETLRDRMNRHALPYLYACGVVKAVTSALAYVHPRGLIHRDIKPENIFIEPLPDGGSRFVVTDFGIVKETGTSDVDGDQKVFIGTPGYAPPEQLRGEDVGPETDIYALCCIVYEILAGHAVFPEETTPNGIVLAHLKRLPRHLAEFVSDVPRHLLDLVMDGLEPDPAKRLVSLTRRPDPDPRKRPPPLATLFGAPFVEVVLAYARGRGGLATMERALANNFEATAPPAPRRAPSVFPAYQAETQRIVGPLPLPPPASSDGATEPSNPPPEALVGAPIGTDRRVIAASKLPIHAAASSPIEPRASQAPLADRPSPVIVPMASVIVAPAVPSNDSFAAGAVSDPEARGPFDPNPEQRSWGPAVIPTSYPNPPPPAQAPLTNTARLGAPPAVAPAAETPSTADDIPGAGAPHANAPLDGAPRALIERNLQSRHVTTTDPSTRAIRDDGRARAQEVKDLPPPEVPLSGPRPMSIAVSVIAGLVLAGVFGAYEVTSHRSAAAPPEMAPPIAAPAASLSGSAAPVSPLVAPRTVPPVVPPAPPPSPSAASAPAISNVQPAAASVAAASPAAPLKPAPARQRPHPHEPPPPASSVPYLEDYVPIHASEPASPPKPKPLPSAGF